MPGTITSANVFLTLSQTILFPTPQSIQGFMADDVFDTPQVRTKEVLMGVDGTLSFGFVWAARPVTVALQANSPSLSFFDTINAQEEAAQDVYPISGTLIYPSISTRFTLVNGAMTDYKFIPDAKRTLIGRRMVLTFNRVIVSPQ
jgi:hypothetical protein